MVVNKNYHIGVKENLVKLFHAKELNCLLNSSIPLLINIDGLPIYKSSTYQFWPILGIVKGSTSEKPFSIGIYGGNKKPASVTEFLNNFISEIKVLEREGFLIENRLFQVTISNLVCDAPARAFLKCIKSQCIKHTSSCCQSTKRAEFWNG